MNEKALDQMTTSVTSGGMPIGSLSESLQDAVVSQNCTGPSNKILTPIGEPLPPRAAVQGGVLTWEVGAALKNYILFQRVADSDIIHNIL